MFDFDSWYLGLIFIFEIKQLFLQRRKIKHNFRFDFLELGLIFLT